MPRLPFLAATTLLASLAAACDNHQPANGESTQSIPGNQGLGGVANGAPGGTNAPANVPSPSSNPAAAGATTPAPSQN